VKSLLLLLLLLLLLPLACAVEVPDSIIRGLVMVESGCEWRSVGDVRGKWSHGADGEVSPFQLAPAALSDMGVTNHARVHRDVVYAESLARLWLAKCYRKHGNWRDALGQWNAGSRFSSATGRNYADRVLNLAGSL
jgi:hypothetical protein